MGKQQIMFGAETQLARLTKLGDPLEKINAAVDWEIFRETIRKRVRKADYSKGGRPPLDEILMFKVTLRNKVPRCKTGTISPMIIRNT